MNSYPSIHYMGPSNTDQHQIYTVSELTTDIKVILEETYPIIWVYGEISNFSIPSSGHFYFTLKDSHAQINAVMFRNQNRNLKFKPEDGTTITGLGRISVYEPRGTYQIIFEYIEPKGTGAIQLAFEQLKKRLADEGLFDEKHKIPLPFLPRKISIITSPTGAVVHDILKVIDRRFSNLHFEIVPIKVQGYGAENEIISAIEMINARPDSDLAILARGGGSLEDFHAFNSEDVARAVFASKIPIISAVGHETDFSITDFVADLRAPTPSVAAELAVPIKKELSKKIDNFSEELNSRLIRYLVHLKTSLSGLSNRLTHPQKKIEDLRLKADDMLGRLNRTFKNSFLKHYERLWWRIERLFSNNPSIKTKILKDKLDIIDSNLNIYIEILLHNRRSILREIEAKLYALSPKAILARGYSITRTIPEAAVVRDPKEVSVGQDLEIMVAGGSFICSVKRIIS